MAESKKATKQQILDEFKKAGNQVGVPQTIEDIDRYISDIVRSNRYIGKSIVFVFDRGYMDDMPRYLNLEYFLTKEDIARERSS